MTAWPVCHRFRPHPDPAHYSFRQSSAHIITITIISRLTWLACLHFSSYFPLASTEASYPPPHRDFHPAAAIRRCQRIRAIFRWPQLSVFCVIVRLQAPAHRHFCAANRCRSAHPGSNTGAHRPHQQTWYDRLPLLRDCFAASLSFCSPHRCSRSCTRTVLGQTHAPASVISPPALCSGPGHCTPQCVGCIVRWPLEHEMNFAAVFLYPRLDHALEGPCHVATLAPARRLEPAMPSSRPFRGSWANAHHESCQLTGDGATRIVLSLFLLPGTFDLRSNQPQSKSLSVDSSLYRVDVPGWRSRQAL